MSRVAPILLAAAIGLGPATIGNAQIDKPRIPEPTERLPAPSKLTVTAGADGPVRVIWSAVDGAAEYSLIRSVPPTGAARLILPNPSDTQYVDLNVTPGKTYYYTVAALNEAGLGGMKAAAPPVTAADTATTRPPEPSRGVRAVLYGSTAEISWSSSMNARTYQVERASITGTGTNWSRIEYGVPCCRARDGLESYPAGSRIFYRVSAVNRTLFSLPPALSNEVTIGGGTPSTDTSTGPLPTDTTVGRLPTDTTPRRLPTDTAAADTAATRPPDPPGGVRAVLRGTTAEISWSSMNDAKAYRVERASSTGWSTIVHEIQCCVVRDGLESYRAGDRIFYRVTAVKRGPFLVLPPPALSNVITIGLGRPPTDTTTGRLPTDTTTGRLPADTAAAGRTDVRSAVVAPPTRIKVGGSTNPGKSASFASLHLQSPRWLSLDPSIATVNSQGRVVGRAAGFAYIVAIGLTPDGSVASMVQRVNVKR